MSDLKAVLFDYGDTLISTRLDWDTVIPKSLSGLSACMQSYCSSLDPVRLCQDFLSLRKAGKIRAATQNIETPASESLSNALAKQGLVVEDPTILQAGVDSFFEAEEQAYTIIPGIAETLHTLHSMGLKLGVISNATCARLVRRALEKRNLLSWFDQIVTSAELGRCKPDPAIFHAILDEMDLQASECVMVGDLLHTDIQGAKRIGMLSILVNFFNDKLVSSPSDPQPDAVVTKPHDLVPIIQRFLT